MFWMGIGITLVSGAMLVAHLFAKRPAHDLGTGGDRWIAEHHVDSL